MSNRDASIDIKSRQERTMQSTISHMLPHETRRVLALGSCCRPRHTDGLKSPFQHLTKGVTLEELL